MGYLFSQPNLRGRLDQVFAEFRHRIQETNRQTFTSRTDEEIVRELIENVQLKAPILKLDKAAQLPTQEIAITRDDYGRQIQVPAMEVTIIVPYDGNRELFTLTPSTQSSVLPQGEVHEDGLYITLRFETTSEFDTKAAYEKEVKSINEWLSWVNGDIHNFKNTLPNRLLPLVAQRRTTLETSARSLGGLGLPVRQARPEKVREKAHPKHQGRTTDQMHDAFISHASEDKDFVEPLAQELKSLGLDVWYDRFVLKVGDSLRESIDKGLSSSKFGVVILSKAFFAKRWPQYELNGLVAKEINGRKVILPVWRNLSHDDVLEYSPTLADKIALTYSNQSIRSIAKELAEGIRAVKDTG